MATKYLSREDAKVLTVIGAGVQAEGLIEAVMAVRNIEEVHFSSRTKEKLKSLLKQLNKNMELKPKRMIKQMKQWRLRIL